MPKPLPDDVRGAMTAGQKIDAIRLLRQQTGLGLAEAKSAVETGLVPDSAEIATNFAALPSEVAAALASGDKIKAIKLLRRTQGMGLKQAKAIVDEASRAANDRANRQAGGLSPGEVPRGGLSAGLAVGLFFVVALAIWFFVQGG